jgi:hypothetical protein
MRWCGGRTSVTAGRSSAARERAGTRRAWTALSRTDRGERRQWTTPKPPYQTSSQGQSSGANISRRPSRAAAASSRGPGIAT